MAGEKSKISLCLVQEARQKQLGAAGLWPGSSCRAPLSTERLLSRKTQAKRRGEAPTAQKRGEVRERSGLSGLEGSAG